MTNYPESRSVWRNMRRTDCTYSGCDRNPGQRGASLILVLAVIVFSLLVLSALVAFATTSQRATTAYTDVRNERYGGDAAIKTAINWVKRNSQLAVDPEDPFAPSVQPCVNHVTTAAGVVTVSCEVEPGSGSGVAPDVGLLPPETMLLLGDRASEPGPYSYSRCASLYDSVVGFFRGTTEGKPEPSFALRRRKRSTIGGLGTCTLRDRGTGPVRVKGNVVAAGKIQFGDIGLAPYAGDGTVRAKRGCFADDSANQNLTSVCTAFLPTRSAPGMPWNGTPSDSDPGRLTVGTPVPINDIRPQFLPIGFDADGTLRDGYSLPKRSTAYVYDPSQNTAGTATVPKYLKPLSGLCPPAGQPLIFLPGWYQDSEVLSQYTANASCPDRTYWFTPNAGPDNELLTDDDETGAFYMDFSRQTGRTCGDIDVADPARWCMGGSALDSSQQLLNSKPRVVVGWPKDWTPFGSTPSGSGTGTEPDTGGRVGVQLTTAEGVEGNFLTYWSNIDRARQTDTQYATYSPCSLWIFTCPSLGSRTLRLIEFSPKVTSGPISEAGASNGRVYVDVTFAMRNASGLTPRVVVDALDDNGVVQTCGEFTLSLASVNTSFSGSGPLPATSKATISAADAKTLADNCGSVSLINRLRISFQANGNWNNQGQPKIYLDGARVYYDSYRGASFPLGTDGSPSSTQGAKSDCDDRKPGGQVIFGGPSHVYIADGSLEVCAGPDPADPSGRQVIGIYGVPAVDSLKPNSNPVFAGGDDAAMDPSNGVPARRIGEPDGSRSSVDITYTGDLLSTTEGRVNLSFGALSIPAGYRVSKVTARVAYDSNNPGAFFDGGTNAEIRVGSCTRELPLTTQTLQAAGIVQSGYNLTLFDRASSNCFGGSTTEANPLSAGRTVTFAARAQGWCVPTSVITCRQSGTFDTGFRDQLDGVELDVTLEPDYPSGYLDGDTTQPMLRPQSGCIVAHPNYGSGQSQPDCALVRADSYRATNDSGEGLCITNCGTSLRGSWVGRVSVKGMVYAPSSAIEIDDNDIAYPLADRGVILRHLWISGAKSRTNYTDPMFGGNFDRAPSVRQAVFTACVQQAADVTANRKCGEGGSDRILTRAGVTFKADPAVTDPLAVSWAAVIDWWSDRVNSGS